jgi:methanogenic corrinoid protein MtbC1
MRAVGDGWHNGNLCVAQEHLASAVLRNVLGSLAYMKSTSDYSSRILFATPADELHEFGILAAAILAAGSGLGIIYLGTNLASEEIILAAKRCSPKAVVLGVARDNPTAQVLREVRSAARKLPPAVELWVGGRSAHGVIGNAANGRVIAVEDFETLEKHFYRIGGRL